MEWDVFHADCTVARFFGGITGPELQEIIGTVGDDQFAAGTERGAVGRGVLGKRHSADQTTGFGVPEASGLEAGGDVGELIAAGDPNGECVVAELSFEGDATQGGGFGE